MLKWISAWIFIQILLPSPVGTNPMSRMASMAALCSENRFEINSYIKEDPKFDWTVDWAKTPDGRYFSNKSPGTALLGAPIFCIVDKLFFGKSETDPTLRSQIQYKARWIVSWLVALLLQILPMAAIVLWVQQKMKEQDASLRAQRWVTLALLFGHTGAIYMNSLWGHGLSVVLCLLAWLTMQSRHWITFGFMLGLALLNDYSVALLFPGFIWVVYQETVHKDFDVRAWIKIALGALAPALFWILYHMKSFGGPLTLPNAFQNPLFLDLKENHHAWFGIFLPYASPEIILRLLFGPERGLLFTQPWVLVAMYLGIKHRKLLDARMHFFMWSGFIMIFWMNASFGGWHGGNTIGPRYLSPILPFFALWIAPKWDMFSKKQKRALEWGLIVSMILFIVSYTITIEPPTTPLWTGFYRASLEKSASTLILRLTLQLSLLFAAWKLEKKWLRF